MNWQPGKPSATFPKLNGFMSCIRLDKEFGEGSLPPGNQKNLKGDSMGPL